MDYLHEQLTYMLPNSKIGFILSKAIIKNVKTIAGAGSKTELRIEERLVKMYGGEKGELKKRVGKVESDKYIFDVHWYESDSKQYDVKLKYGKEK